tara:strand:+ start:1535 stop:2575 length:1041 start_codon:yes stop_codon:yes gene_type:complete
VTVKNLNVEFANFVFHLGNNDLLDNFIQFVHPAFFNNYKRKFNETTYFFHNCRMFDVPFKDTTRHFLYGRLVKDYLLHQEQLIEGENLVPVDNVYPNAPSSMFILCLENHRLFYIKEHKDAPPLETFRATVLNFVKQRRDDVINELIKDNEKLRKERGDSIGKVTKTALKITYPEPKLNIFPMSSDASIREFVNGLKTVRLLKFDIFKPNNEANLNDIFDGLRDVSDDLGTTVSTVTYTKKGNTTLDHESVTQKVIEASLDNNVEYKIEGRNHNNDKITGTNEEFRLRVPLEEKLDTPRSTALVIYQKFQELVRDGLVRFPEEGETNSIKDKVKGIVNLLKKFGDG